MAGARRWEVWRWAGVRKAGDTRKGGEVNGGVVEGSGQEVNGGNITKRGWLSYDNQPRFVMVLLSIYLGPVCHSLFVSF